METADASVGDEEPMFSAAHIAAMEDDDGGIPVIDDMMEALTPWRTGDLGCVSIRRAGEFSASEGETGKTTDPHVLAEAERKRVADERAAEEKAYRSRASLVLIQLIQAAIERRESLLREMGEEPGLPAGRNVKAVQHRGNSASVGRLALEPYTDQALAREDLDSVDLNTARVDMSELLPRPAAEHRGAGAATARAAAAAAGAGVGTGALLESADGDASVYSYYDDPDGDSNSHYTCVALPPRHTNTHNTHNTHLRLSLFQSPACPARLSPTGRRLPVPHTTSFHTLTRRLPWRALTPPRVLRCSPRLRPAGMSRTTPRGAPTNPQLRPSHPPC